MTLLQGLGKAFWWTQESIWARVLRLHRVRLRVLRPTPNMEGDRTAAKLQGVGRG